MLRPFRVRQSVARRVEEPKKSVEVSAQLKRVPISLDELPTQRTRRGWMARTAVEAEALFACDDAMQDIFATARGGRDLRPEHLEEPCSKLIGSLAEVGVASWVDALRSHHDNTYRHCLVVTGVAVSFGQTLGFREADLARISVGGLLHDIGKALIPTELLDKNGALTEEERFIIETHPAKGREVMLKIGAFGPEVVDIVTSHHEFLDGSGYPNRMSGSEISDIIRLTTIADIYAALTEDRSYRPAMTAATALEILEGMGPKLDVPIVRAFCRFIRQSFADAG